MSKQILARCQALLVDLEKAELHQLRLFIDGMLGEASKHPAPAAQPPRIVEDWLAQAIGRALVRKGQLRNKDMDLELTRAAQRVSTFRRESTKQREWLLANLKFVPARQTTYAKLGDIVVKALIAHTSWMQSIDVDGLMRNIYRIPAALDEQLPGYLSTDMLDILLHMHAETR